MPVDSLQVTTSPKAAAVKTRGDHAGVASTPAGLPLQAAKASAISPAAAAVNNAMSLTTGNAPAVNASAGAGSAAAAATSTVNSQAATVSTDSASTTAGNSVVPAASGSSAAAAAILSSASTAGGNNSQTTSDGNPNGGSPADAQIAASMPFANLAGSVMVSHPGSSTEQGGVEGTGPAASATSTGSPGTAERAESDPQTESPTLISARVLENVQQTEMRVGVHPEGMGAIEIRAVMHGDQLGASITAQQADTHQWLVSHVSELTQALNSHDVRVSSLSINDSTSENSAQSGSGQSNPQGQGQQNGQPASKAEIPEAILNTKSEASAMGGSYTRTGLDLRA